MVATVDTVVIWVTNRNPQNDVQAMSQTYRIGQKDNVNIHR